MPTPRFVAPVFLSALFALSWACGNPPVSNCMSLQLAYGDPVVAVVGQPIEIKRVLYGSGSAAGPFTVDPPLPAGLSLDASTATISGTPTAASAETTYTVTPGCGMRATVAITVTAATTYDHFVYTANSDTSVSQFGVGTGGALAALSPPTASVGGTSPIQNQVAITPDGKFAYVVDAGANVVWQFARATNGTLTALTPAQVGTGGTPQAIAFDPASKFAYVINKFDETIGMYTIGATGALTAVPTATVATGHGPVGIAVGPNGRYLYVTNLADDNVSQYAIDAATGVLTPLVPATANAGNGPTSIVIGPSGRNAYVANAGDDTISQFEIVSGLLVPLTPATVQTGSVAGQIATSAAGPYLYVVSSDLLNDVGSISQYGLDGAGALSPLATPTVAVTGLPSSIAVDSGGYAYVATDAGLLQYRIASGGALTALTPPKVGTTSSNWVTVSSPDVLPTFAVVEDFEGDTSDWTLGGTAAIAVDATTTSHALHLSLAEGTCGTSSGARSVTIPADAASIHFRLSGDVLTDPDNQFWLSVQDGASINASGIPTLPVSGARVENWCVPAGSPGKTVTLTFFFRTQTACHAMDGWIEDIVLSPVATGCQPMTSGT